MPGKLAPMLDYAATLRACDTRPIRMAFNFQRLRAPSRRNSPANRAIVSENESNVRSDA